MVKLIDFGSIGEHWVSARSWIVFLLSWSVP